MKKYKIAVVIVTFNRKYCLANCLKALLNQTQLPDYIYIIDNHSNDDSREYIEKEKLLFHNEVSIRYIYLEKNTGGAGGFYTGMKMAFDETKSDAFLLMDDDGIPDSMEVENLCKHIKKYDYINAFVLNKDNPNEMSFSSKIKDRSRTIFEENANEDKVVLNYANPFNGSMYSRQLVERVGFPNPNLFIYGDEINYQLRIKQARFKFGTAIDAIHYHPVSKGRSERVNLLGLKFNLSISNRPLAIYCSWRNTFYNFVTCKIPIIERMRIILYAFLTLVKYKKISSIAFDICFQAIKDGLSKNLTKHYYYLNSPVIKEE